MPHPDRGPKIDIALAFDKSYLPHACVLMRSIVENNPDTGRLRFWLAYEGDNSAGSHPWITQLSRQVEVHWLKASLPQDLPSSPWSPYISRATYIRLTLPDLLPPEISRVLYLDCDTICLGGLGELFDVDLGGNVIGAVRDAICRRLADEGKLPGLVEESSDIDHQALYFNAGVLLIDTVEWRRLNIGEATMAYLDRYAHCPRYLDQDALNYVLYGRWLRLPRRWNYMLHWRLEPQHGGNPESATIVHSVGSKKFWSDNWAPKHLEDSVLRTLYFRHRAVVDGVGSIVDSANAAENIR